MTINSRAKGARSERELCRILREHGWTNATRTSDGRAQHSRGDIAHGPQGVHVESKSGRLNLTAALDQIRRDASPLDLPLLCWRPDRHPWLAVTYLEDFLPLLALKERG